MQSKGFPLGPAFDKYDVTPALNIKPLNKSNYRDEATKSQFCVSYDRVVARSLPGKSVTRRDRETGSQNFVHALLLEVLKRRHEFFFLHRL